jgi:phage gp29-like protein
MKIKDFLYRFIPSRFIIRHEPPAISHTMDAGRVGAVLRSAEAGNMDDFFSLSRDIITGHGHTQTEFGKRKLAVLGKPLKLTIAAGAPDATTDEVRTHFEELPSFLPAMIHLLDSSLYPVSIVQKIYKQSHRPGWRFEIEELRPVPYHLLDYSTGTLRIRNSNQDGMPTGGTMPVDPVSFIIHRGHLLQSTPDTWGGPMRAVMFWWLFATQDRDWWIRFLERFGAPFLIGKYDETNPESRYLLERAFSAATRLFGLAIPNDADVQIAQANTTQGADAFERFQKFANNEISKIILGQTTSSDVQSGGGLNSGGQASAQSAVREDIREYDAMALANTLRTQLLVPLWHINGWTTPIPAAGWGAEDNQTVEALSLAVERSTASGLELTDEGLDAYNKAIGLPFRRVSTAAAASTLPALSGLAATASPTRRPALAAADRIAAAGAPDLADALSETLSPLRDLVMSSTSVSDLEAKLRAAFPTLNHALAAEVAMLSLTATAANASEQY